MRSAPELEKIVTLRIRPRRDNSHCRNRRPGTTPYRRGVAPVRRQQIVPSNLGEPMPLIVMGELIEVRSPPRKPT
jgi:hypothetical protein